MCCTPNCWHKQILETLTLTGLLTAEFCHRGNEGVHDLLARPAGGGDSIRLAGSAMVLLDFQIDEAALRKDITRPLESEDAGDLAFLFFVMPVRLKVDSTDLLEVSHEEFGGGTYVHPYVPLPLLNVATIGLQEIISLPTKGTAAYDLPDVGARLDFQLKGKRVTVFSQMNEESAVCDYRELLEAFQSFALNVRTFLRERASSISRHPHWGKWLMGPSSV